MREYEIALVAQADLDESSLTALIDKAKGWVTNSGGSIVKVDQWGRRRLAYPIRKQTEGQYVFITANLEAKATHEIERSLRFTEQVLRFAVIRTDE
jgi:small subunit ribosomal protein S6